MTKPDDGIRRLVRAARFSLAGLLAAWTNEAAFRQECVLVAVLLPVALWLGRTASERSILIATLLVVLIIELLNSAIEALVDRVSEEHHPLSGRAKDLGSAAVFVSLILTGAVWSLIGWQRLDYFT